VTHQTQSETDSTESVDPGDESRAGDTPESADPGDESRAGDTPESVDPDEDTSPTDDSAEELGVLDIRELVAEVSEMLLGHPFDGITAVERADDGGWRAVFEVVERSAVPDTQDMIGRYELHLSPTGDVQEYSLQQRFKRSALQGGEL
jgi:hypothetical protein